jgi:hypothetical protein
VFLGIYSEEPLLECEPIVDTDDTTVIRKMSQSRYCVVWFLIEDIIKTGRPCI